MKFKNIKKRICIEQGNKNGLTEKVSALEYDAKAWQRKHGPRSMLKAKKRIAGILVSRLDRSESS